MGVNDRAQNRKDEQRAKQQEKRKLRSSAATSDTTADWTGCDGTLLAKFIATVARDGGAARFGYTRDGGAYAVGIYGDGEPYTVYISPKEDLDEWLKNGIEDFSK